MINGIGLIKKSEKDFDSKISPDSKEFESIIENMTNAFIILSKVDDNNGLIKNFKIEYYNKTFVNFSGVENQDVSGRDITEVWNETEDEWIKNFREVFTTGVTKTFIQYHKPTDKFYSCRVFRLDESDGRLYIQIDDVTEKNKKEEVLRESEERFRTAFTASPDSVNINRLSDGLYVNINEGFTALTGYTEEDIKGKSSLDINIWADPEDRNRLVQGLREKGYVKNLEAIFRLKNGQKKYGLMSAKIIKISGVDHILSITRDITERIEAEKIIRKSYDEKDTLIKELYHRTKNNMLVISALLSLQLDYNKNPEFKYLVEESINRIQSIALVHQMLYKGQDLSRIRLDEYITKLVEQLMLSFNISNNKIKMIYELDNVYTLIDTAIPCGIVLNEILSNCLKYAFPDGKTGCISIKMVKNNDDITIEVSDNGIGVHEGFDFYNQQSLGLHIIISIVKEQLKGNINFISDGGVKSIIKFKDKDGNKDLRI